jgi:hypothetical protein
MLLKKKNKHLEKINKRVLNPFLSNIFNFAQNCVDNGEIFKADAYLSHDVSPLLSAMMLSREFGGKIFLDAIEVPEHKKRSGGAYQKWPTSVHYIVDLLREGISPHIAGVLTVSFPLAERLKRKFINVSCIENYRYLEQINKIKKLEKTVILRVQTN